MVGMVNKHVFTEVAPGLYHETSTGLPWSTRSNSGNPYGKEITRAFNKNSKGYYCVRLGAKPMLFHRVVWEHFNGPIPPGMMIDHINNCKDDNRLENLQLSSASANTRKQKMHSNNTCGYAGVYWDKQTGEFRARISTKGKSKHLGSFDTAEEAYAAYLVAKKLYHGEASIGPLSKI
jgi:hypothetical protein